MTIISTVIIQKICRIFTNIHKQVKFQEYDFKNIVLILFLYETWEDIPSTELDNEFQRFKAIIKILND